MAYDDEQCPSRGPGLKHATDNGRTCDECGKVRPNATPQYTEWFRRIIEASKPKAVVLSGEAVPDKAPVPQDTEKAPEAERFKDLTERQWHALAVERDYWEAHPDPDDTCDARPDEPR